jgi:hypothetical protein
MIGFCLIVWQIRPYQAKYQPYSGQTVRHKAISPVQAKKSELNYGNESGLTQSGHSGLIRLAVF